VASFLLRTTRGASLLRRPEDDIAVDRAEIEPVIFLPAPSLSSAFSSLLAASSPESSLFGQDELESHPASDGVELNDEEAAEEELSPYYRRDKREPASVLALLSDPAGLAALLEQRHHARQNGDYRQVSAVDRQLQRDHGIRAHDQPPVWTRTALPLPVAFRRRQARKRTRQMQRAFGPTGHPYRYRRRGGATVEDQPPSTQGEQDYDNGNHNHHYRRSAFCDLTVSEIHALLRRLTQCRGPSTNNNHNQIEEADAIRLELAIHGVRVCDETWQWWTTTTTTDDDNGWELDDVPVAAFASNSNNTAFGATNSSSRRSTSSSSSSAATSFSSFTRPSPPPLPTISYTQDPLSKPLRGSAGRRRDDKDKDSITRVRQRVEQLVRERAEARARGELQTTNVAGEQQQQEEDEYDDDHWARELYCTYNVGINDRTRRWSVGGRFLATEDGEGEGLGVEEWKPQPPQQPIIENDGERADEHILRFPSTRRFLFRDRDERDFDSETRYRCSSRSPPRTTMSKQSWRRVQALIQDRIHKREEGRFLEADAIRRELWYTYVSLDDC